MIEHLLTAKELALYDFGSIRIVKPTGRYIDAEQYQNPEYYEPRGRYMIEVRGSGLFSFDKKWVSSNNLKQLLIKKKQ